MKHTNIKGRPGDWTEAQKQAMVAMEEQFGFAEKAPRQGEEGLEDEGQELVVKKTKVKAKPVATNAKVAAAKAKVERLRAKVEATKSSVPIDEAAGADKQNSIAFLRTGGMTADEMSRVNRFISTFSTEQLAKFNKAIHQANDEKALELLYKKTLLLALQKGF